MAVSVGGQPLPRLDQLSPKAKLVLGFVVGGKDWFEWAVKQLEGDAFGFVDEAGFIEAVQSGIHGSGMTLLPKLGLGVHVQRLWQLSPEVLGALEAAENNGEGDNRPNLKTRRTLAANNLLPHAELATGTEILARWGIEEHPVFQAMSLFDQTIVFNLLNLATETIVDTEAAEFAIAQAVSPAEFVDYFQLYLTVADSIKGKPKAVCRRARAREAVELLEPHVTGSLRCPHAPRNLSPAEAFELWRAWLITSRSMGFSRISQGLREVVDFASGRITDSDTASKAAESYARTLNKLVRNHQPGAAQLSQDGSMQHFEVDGRGVRAVLARNRLMETLTIETLRKNSTRD